MSFLMFDMSTKAKKLTQIIFGKSSSSSNDAKQKREHDDGQHFFSNEIHYENLMAPTFSLRRFSSVFMNREHKQEDEEEQEEEDEGRPLIPIAIPQLVENMDNPREPFGRVVVFGDKPKRDVGKRLIRARSSSPKLKGPRDPSTVHSILKNSPLYRANKFGEKKDDGLNEVFRKLTKSTLYRTKSTPATPITKNKSIPVAIPSPPDCPLKTLNAKLSQSNPLLNVSWNCPTLEKQKDAILGYFKTVNIGSRTDDHVYEEIERDNSPSVEDTNARPKLAPKKVRLNLLPTYQDTPSGNSEYENCENYYQHPIYDKVGPGTKETKAQSNRATPMYNNIHKSHSFSSPFNLNCPDLDKGCSMSPPGCMKNAPNPNNCAIDVGESEVPTGVGVGLAIFASEVALQAMAKKQRCVKNRSTSFSFGSKLDQDVDSSNDPENVEKSQDLIPTTDNCSGACEMDEIYLRLDKRGKKIGTPTSRLLKRHQSQIVGRVCTEEELWLDNTGIRSSGNNDNSSKRHISTVSDDKTTTANSSATTVNTLTSKMKSLLKNYDKTNIPSSPVVGNCQITNSCEECHNSCRHEMNMNLSMKKESSCEVEEREKGLICFPPEGDIKNNNKALAKEDKTNDKNKRAINLKFKKVEGNAKSSEAESGLSTDSFEEEEEGGDGVEDYGPANRSHANNGRKSLRLISSSSCSSDAIYSSCTNSTSSTNSSEEESESNNNERYIRCQNPLPARSTRATNKVKPAKTLSQSQLPPKACFHNSPHLVEIEVKNDSSSGLSVGSTSDNFITNVSIIDRCCSNPTLNTNNHQFQTQNQSVSGFINLADVFPHIERNNHPCQLTKDLCNQSEETNAVLTINVIDTTQSIPVSGETIYPVIGAGANAGATTTGDNNFIDCESIPPSVLDLDWYRSLKRGSVLLNQSVTVIHETVKDRKNKESSSFDTSKKLSPLLTELKGALRDRDQLQIQHEETQQPQDNFCESKINKKFNNSAIMSAPTLMASNATTTTDEKISAVTGLLIDIGGIDPWDNPTPSPISSSSPNSQSDPELLSSSSSSDLSEDSVQLATMTESVLRQEAKYFDEDGGFESFQVMGVEGDMVDAYDYDHSQSDENENDGQILELSKSAAHRQRTFAQSSQNVPEEELKQKATTVLDLINAEISDLHMRELELRKKNRVADGKQDYDNDSEDLAEGSSQADSDDYSDSAVDVESYSARTSNSSGNVTPADKDKMQDRSSSREGSGSPQSFRGSYHPQEVEKQQNQMVLEDELAHELGEDVSLMKNSSSSSAVLDHSVSVDVEEEEESAVGGTTGTGNKQQGGVKVRPIVEEEVKSIELSVEKETPIEREIRIVREREDEFRRMRSLSSGTSIDIDDDQTTHTISSSDAKEEEKDKKVEEDAEQEQPDSVSPSTLKAAFSFEGHSGSAGPKDIQYEMATARLKREIEENMMRERELFREGRLKSLSAPEPQQVHVEEPVVTLQRQSSEEKSEDDSSVKEEALFSPVEETAPEGNNARLVGARRLLLRLGSTPNTTSQQAKGQAGISPPAPQSAPAVNSARFFTPSGFTNTYNTNNNSPQSLTFQPKGTTNGPPHSLSLAKPQFTSIEKMILKGSFTFNKGLMAEEQQRHFIEESRMEKISMMPDPLQIIQRTDSIDETDEGSTMPENKPRRKYIPAQDKIQIELKEQMKRENELSQLRARWKSTPDLSNSVDKPDEDKEEEAVPEAQAEGDNDELTKPSSLRRQLSTSTQKLTMMPEVTSSDVIRMNKPTVRRRNSALINQWEELIKQQQQKNSSKN